MQIHAKYKHFTSVLRLLGNIINSITSQIFYQNLPSVYLFIIVLHLLLCTGIRSLSQGKGQERSLPFYGSYPLSLDSFHLLAGTVKTCPVPEMKAALYRLATAAMLLTWKQPSCKAAASSASLRMWWTWATWCTSTSLVACCRLCSSCCAFTSRSSQ